MQNINKVIITGNVTRDPEQKATAGGTSVLLFGIACNDSRRNQNGEYEDYPNFFECVIYGNRAEALARFLKKGMHVTIAGRLHYSSWEKDGQKRSKVEIVAEEVELPPKSAQQPASEPQMQQTGNYANDGQNGAQNVSQSVYDEDIPF